MQGSFRSSKFPGQLFVYSVFVPRSYHSPNLWYISYQCSRTLNVSPPTPAMYVYFCSLFFSSLLIDLTNTVEVCYYDASIIFNTTFFITVSFLVYNVSKFFSVFGHRKFVNVLVV